MDRRAGVTSYRRQAEISGKVQAWCLHPEYPMPPQQSSKFRFRLVFASSCFLSPPAAEASFLRQRRPGPVAPRQVSFRRVHVMAVVSDGHCERRVYLSWDAWSLLSRPMRTRRLRRAPCGSGCLYLLLRPLWQKKDGSRRFHRRRCLGYFTWVLFLYSNVLSCVSGRDMSSCFLSLKNSARLMQRLCDRVYTTNGTI